MSSILTNNSAMTALQTLRKINQGLNETQSRISTGLQVRSAKENAAYFSISSTMKADSSMFSSINEGLTLTKNSVATARLGAEQVQSLAQQFVDRVAFAQDKDSDSRSKIKDELKALTDRMGTIIDQSTFNGESLVNSTSSVTITTGVKRTGSFGTTSYTFNKVDLTAIKSSLANIGFTTTGTLTTVLSNANTQLKNAINAATSLGIAEKTIEGQKAFLTSIANQIDSGVGAMIDADMEKEAARLQAYQTQQQLATQSLSIANQAPQNLMSLFR